MASPAKLFRSVGGGLFVAVCLILVLQATASRMLTVEERNLPIPGLHQLPLELGKWKARGEEALERNVTEYLKPDEYILRDYVDQSADASINLFVAYFKSLQNTYGPHSPRVCLPGAGWLVSSTAIKFVQISGRAESIPINEYVMEKNGSRILVFYWYQNERNVWAEEFRAKLRLLPDLIKYKRSDVSLVRLITPIHGSAPENEIANCLEFTSLVFTPLVERFGSAK